jgi:UDP-glucose:(heptosyl)LPS alpha-1,3-glucosyltransferase
MVGRYFNRQGGVSRWLAECADRGADDFRTTVLSHHVEDVRDCGAPIVRLPMVQHPKWLQLPSFDLSVRRSLVAGGADLIHVHNPQFRGGDVYTAHSCNAAHIAGRRAEAKPLQRVLSHAWPPHLSGNWCERAAYRPDDARPLPIVAAVSHQVAGELRDFVGVPEGNLTVTHPGVDIVQFRPLSEEERAERSLPSPAHPGHQLRLVFVGYEFDRKGIAPILDAMGRLGPGVVHLDVLGQDNPAPYLARAASLGISEDVHFHGHVQQPQQLIARADALVLASVYEAFPLVVMEALACGTPVIASRESNAGEIVRPEVTGMLYGPARSADQLARTLTAFIAARARWPEMRRSARSAAENRTWDKAWEETKLVYDEALRRLKGRDGRP